MCVVSMVMDYYSDKWYERLQRPLNIPPMPKWPPYTPEPRLTEEEVKEFRELLRRAREYDKKNNEPDCELEEKKEKVRKLAEELGVKISFDQ